MSSSTSANVQPLLNTFTGPQLRQTVYAMLGAVIVVLVIACVNVMNMQFGRAALAREGTGDPRRARRHPLASRSANDDGEFPRRRHGRSGRRVLRRSGRSACSSAPRMLCRSRCPTGSSSPLMARCSSSPWASCSSRRFVSGLVPAMLSARGNAAEMMKEGGRGNSSRLVECDHARPGHRPDRADRRAAHRRRRCRSNRSAIRPSQNYGYDENAVYSARMGLMEGDYPTRRREHSFSSAPCVHCAAIQLLRMPP